MRNASKLISIILLGIVVPSLSYAQRPPGGMGGVPGAGDADHQIPVGTMAPDGIGVVVSPARTAPTANSIPTPAGTPAKDTRAGRGGGGPMVDASVVRPLPVGAEIPTNSVVTTVDGNPFDLNAAVASQPTILIFYRGGWCPYCNAHLRELQQSVGKLKEMGYQLLAISTDTPEAIRKTMSETDFDYQLLSDASVEVAEKFGLKYKVTDEYLEHVAGKGTDLNAVNGGYLLTPGAFVMDTKGIIRFAYVNNNYTVRVSQDALLKAAADALN